MCPVKCIFALDASFCNGHVCYDGKQASFKCCFKLRVQVALHVLLDPSAAKKKRQQAAHRPVLANLDFVL